MEIIMEIKTLKNTKVSMDIIKEIISYCKSKKIDLVISDKLIKVLKWEYLKTI